MLILVIFYILLHSVTNGIGYSIPDPNISSSISSRVINGKNATLGQFPFQVGVLAKIDAYDFFVQAAGCLLSKDYVLTVAHAVQIDGIQYIEVHFGVIQLENPEEKRKIITVHEDGFIVHKDYRFIFSRRFNDIALLKLPEPVEFTDTIQPIALPTRADAKINLEGTYLRLAGWGRYTDANRNSSIFLKYADLRIMDPKICKHFYRDLDPHTMICAYTSLGTSACGGDSGGAVVYTDPKTNRQFAAGLVSYGFYTCATDGFPQIHTRITSFLDWIADHTNIKIL